MAAATATPKPTLRGLALGATSVAFAGVMIIKPAGELPVFEIITGDTEAELLEAVVYCGIPPDKIQVTSNKDATRLIIDWTARLTLTVIAFSRVGNLDWTEEIVRKQWHKKA
jgi:hypothetical protein